MPTLLAQDQEHGLIVMSDLGVLPTLADLLLGDDRGAAWAGARAWTGCSRPWPGATPGRRATRRRTAGQPSRPSRQLMVSRWRWGALNLRAGLPALAAAFGDAAAWALDQWGADVEPTGYRAFR